MKINEKRIFKRQQIFNDDSRQCMPVIAKNDSLAKYSYTVLTSYIF